MILKEQGGVQQWKTNQPSIGSLVISLPRFGNRSGMNHGCSCPVTVDLQCSDRSGSSTRSAFNAQDDPVPVVGPCNAKEAGPRKPVLTLSEMVILDESSRRRQLPEKVSLDDEDKKDKGKSLSLAPL